MLLGQNEDRRFSRKVGLTMDARDFALGHVSKAQSDPLEHWAIRCLPVAILILTGIPAFNTEKWTALVPAALLFGWTQIGGRCGTAHVNTMGFLWRINRPLWLKATVAYTCFGLVSSTMVGAVLGWIGQQIGGRPNSPSLWLVALLALILAGREMGWLRFRLLEWRCQTDRNWAYKWGFISAAAMWGFHIGLGFVTVITYGGFWLVVAAIIAMGKPGYGTLLMGTYWIGRALPLWMISPLIYRRPWEPESVYPLFRPAQALGLAWVAVVTFLIVVSDRIWTR
jgi:cytochrome c biogenesis protein CcdA